MRENICEQRDQQQRVTFQNMQTAHTINIKKKTIKKWAEDLNRHFSPGENVGVSLNVVSEY